ncbi:CoA transferase [uncultured Oscillibacter sp.]|uniref:CaiB/BaiF CoA transferase family protein n=1 Tax=uncultured Oscillibacter sp. TaxID=876091 RepID=UPI00261C0F9B|nr:CoA transferase [uncultured Oscillibacter sp.]
MKPLEGVRVLDLTQAYSGPFCTMHLADHGAEVIKVESLSGDQCRTWGPLKNGHSAYYAYINRNKRGIRLDLKTERGKEALRRLIANVDVVCENFRVGTFEKLGFSYEKLKEINPRIIYGSISGFGLDGPLAHRPCYDIVAQAMSGLMSVTGYPDQDCVKAGPSFGDNYSGTYLALGICMALYQRERTGEGQRLDVAMLDTLFSVMENFIISYTVAGLVPGRMGNIDPGIAPFDSFHAKDGAFVMGCGTDRFWADFCRIIGREDLIDQPAYRTNVDRCRNYLPELKRVIEDWSSQYTLDQLEEMIAGAGIPFGRILDVRQASELEQLRVRKMLWEVYDPAIGEVIRIPGSPIKMHGRGDEARSAAPSLGQDNRTVLREIAGYTDEEIDAMEAEHVI